MKTWLHETAAIFFSSLRSQNIYILGQKTNALLANYKVPKTYIRLHFIIKISTDLMIGTSKKHFLHTSMLSFETEATVREFNCSAEIIVRYNPSSIVPHHIMQRCTAGRSRYHR